VGEECFGAVGADEVGYVAADLREGTSEGLYEEQGEGIIDSLNLGLMRPFYSLPRLLITIVLAGVFAFGVPVFVDTREYTSAVYNWAKKPTLENGTVLTRESAKYRRAALITHIAVGGVLFLLINLSWSLFARRSAPDGSPR
jgi:hypothetical protein